ncbi:hypothetical protein [Bosea lathyri]|nr:hypothetical protein [Bosea lathyri]
MNTGKNMPWEMADTGIKPQPPVEEFSPQALRWYSSMAGMLALRTSRAVFLGLLAVALLKAQPFPVASIWWTALYIALLSTISMTKWVSAGALALLLAGAIVPVGTWQMLVELARG